MGSHIFQRLLQDPKTCCVIAPIPQNNQNLWSGERCPSALRHFCSLSSTHASLSACFIARPGLLYGAFYKRRLGHTTGCQIIGRCERAQAHFTNCIYLYWLGNRTVNSGWLDFILIFTTCLTWPLAMCLATKSLSSAIYNMWGFLTVDRNHIAQFCFCCTHPHFSVEGKIIPQCIQI